MKYRIVQEGDECFAVEELQLFGMIWGRIGYLERTLEQAEEELDRIKTERVKINKYPRVVKEYDYDE